jgi:hypothetical protein
LLLGFSIPYSTRSQSSNVRWVCCLLLFQPLFPVTGPLLAVHDGDNPDAVWLIEIDHSIGENG